ncbi:hypothetical protein OCK74_00615 [Chitinophagaceae bacterium LB-8]|uniref:Uncharacterized protein n=1 Tax=Paraflavisolibacter caeni TaxID=2982496 RepID=A0A9X2XMQ7_9BACT|nr:hypothetical protein [Paraflavisolibacter caeni]MCU7547588.1 hypothetical protein [Paraflavisolibacter caeni]
MNTISFSYNGKTFESEIEYSLHKEPNYFWCYLSDPELIEDLGKNCILFLIYNGKFKTPHYYSIQHQSLINSMKVSIRQKFEIFKEKTETMK